MKKLSKILSIVMIAMMMVSVTVPVLATTIGGVSIQPDISAGQDAVGMGNKILGIIQAIGTIAGVGILMLLGIKYMMGSAEEKAEYKKTMIPYVIGLVLLIAAVNIVSIVVDVAGKITA